MATSIRINMARPGGWNLNGLEFSQEARVRALVLGNDGAEEVPLNDFMLERNPTESSSLKKPTIQLLESRGGDRVGITAPRDLVERICQSWGIPERFLQKMNKPGSLPYFVRLIEETYLPTQTRSVEAINLGFRWGSGHANYVVFFGRFDIKNSTFQAFLSSRDVLECSTALMLLASESDLLQKHPLELFRLIFESCEHYVDRDAQYHNERMIKIGVSLQIMKKPWADGWGISPTDYSLNNGSTIYASLHSVSWLKKNCNELRDIGQRYLDLIEEIRTVYHHDMQDDGIGEITHRLKLHCHGLVYLEGMLAGQFNFQSNLLMQHQAHSSKNMAAASQKDASSMKTVSYLTLIFLPATFVSAIFSTTIFDFQNWNSSDKASGVVSPAWWVFVLSCGLATLITVGAWFFWHRSDVERQRNREKLWDNIVSDTKF